MHRTHTATLREQLARTGHFRVERFGVNRETMKRLLAELDLLRRVEAKAKVAVMGERVHHRLTLKLLRHLQDHNCGDPYCKEGFAIYAAERRALTRGGERIGALAAAIQGNDDALGP